MVKVGTAAAVCGGCRKVPTIIDRVPATYLPTYLLSLLLCCAIDRHAGGCDERVAKKKLSKLGHSLVRAGFNL